MFKELMPVIADRPLTITVAALADGKIRVCVIPQSQQKDEKVNDKVGSQKEVTRIPDASIKALTTPLALTGTAEDLDAELCEKLTTYAGSHAQLQHGIAQATQEITDALQAIEDRNKAKSKPKTDAKKGVTEPKKGEVAAKQGEQGPPPGETLPLAWCIQPAATAVSSHDRPTSDHHGEEKEAVEVAGND